MRPIDNPENNRTLPLPELNPLLNPVLGQHMGRWAEVYFTSPPEKREEAVLQLLRELERTSEAQPEPPAAHRNEVVNGIQPPQSSPHRPNAEAGTPCICPSCRESNPPDQVFCGACGSRLDETISPPTEGREWPAEQAPKDRDSDRNSDNDPELHEAGEPSSSHRDVDDRQASVPSGVYDYPRRSNWSYEEEARQHALRERRTAQRNRISMIAALALLIVALAFMAWRGSQVWSGNSHPLPQDPAQAAKRPVEQPQPATPTAHPPEHPGPVARQAARTLPAATAAEQSQPVVEPTGNGSEELTIAEGYLHGTAGKTRDSAEAAKWLWKSVAKQNAAATVELSDLYLRGDGVGKNCDQARLLLDAAARKNAPGAAERIRNLPAFGCP